MKPVPHVVLDPDSGPVVAVPEPHRSDFRPYRPSNGTEGQMFEDRWCSRCTGFRGGRCSILFRASIHDVGEPEYPRQWVMTPDGHRCTSFEDRASVPVKPRNRHKPQAGKGKLFC